MPKKTVWETLSEFEQARLKKKLYEDSKERIPTTPQTFRGQKVLSGDGAIYFLESIKQRRQRKVKNKSDNFIPLVAVTAEDINHQVQTGTYTEEEHEKDERLRQKAWDKDLTPEERKILETPSIFRRNPRDV